MKEIFEYNTTEDGSLTCFYPDDPYQEMILFILVQKFLVLKNHSTGITVSDDMRSVSVLQVGERLQPNAAHHLAGNFRRLYDPPNSWKSHLFDNLFKTQKASQKTTLPH